jgi:signal transduction histidine kinase/ActR/RegA family two-component response regulator/HAMP domain-containing protein
MAARDQRSIRQQLTRIIVSISSIALLLTAGAIAVYEYVDFRRAHVRDSIVLADVVASNVSGTLAFDDAAAGKAALAALRSDQHVMTAALYDANGERFTEYRRDEGVAAAPPRAGAEGALFEGGRLTIVRPVVHNHRRLGTIYISMDQHELRERLLVFGGLVLLTLAAAVGMTVLLSAKMQQPITQPILRLAETARSISERKDFSVRAPALSGGEIGTLTAAFNNMLGVIEEQRQALLASNERLQGEVTDRQLAEQRASAHAARLAQLNQLTRAIAERQDVESVFQTVVGSVEEQLPVDFACVCVYEREREVLKVSTIGSRSLELARDLGVVPPYTLAIESNGLERCIRGELIYEPNTPTLPAPFARRAGGIGLRSLVIAPLAVETQVFGVLIAARRPSAAFTAADCEFLRQLSEHVALATHQAQLYTALQKAYEDLRQTQQAVMQQERLRALGQMASGIAHDINNAISPVSLYIESMIEKEPHLSAQGRERLTIVQRAIDDVANTVSRMRDFYRQRPQAISLVRVNLNTLADQVIDLTKARWFDMPQQRGVVIELKRSFAPGLAAVKGVETEIREALTNLVFNAVDAMPRGGTLTLRTVMMARAVDTAQPAPEKRVGIEVSDTGTGMSEETLRRCMEPFFTTKGERGSGLGLAMVYGMVKRHGGEIELSSEVGQGTTVRLLFPVAPEPEAFFEPPELSPPGRLRILLVDDDPLLIKSVGETLEADGHVVVPASGGQAGINLFRDTVAGGETFDAVITDLGMPYVDGRRVAAAVKAASPLTPVFLLTGWGNRLVAEGDIPPEVDRILNKPPKLRDLREALATVKRVVPV